jgi:hypothetical protein
MHNICFERLDGAFPIRLIQTAIDSFTVEYGMEIKTSLSYIEAAHRLGECLMHAALCESKIRA